MIRWLVLCAALLLALPAQAQPTSPRIAFLYDGGESTGPAELRRAADAYPDATIDIYAPGDGGLALKEDTDLTGYTLVVLDGAARGMALSAVRIEAVRAATRLLVIGGDGRAAGNIDAAVHPDLQTYWDNRSLDNDTALIGYLLRNLLGDASAFAPFHRASISSDGGCCRQSPTAPGQDRQSGFHRANASQNPRGQLRPMLRHALQADREGIADWPCAPHDQVRARGGWPAASG